MRATDSAQRVTPLLVCDKMPSHFKSCLSERGRTILSETQNTILGVNRSFFVLLTMWVISSAYMAVHLKRGWVPHDDGAFGESALRVLNGELPHRDFDEIYTGGLAFVHALAFRELGINLISMRYVLFVFFVAWVPAVFYVASRFVSDYGAAAIVLLAVAWSVPNYAAPVPSWYNLFFATFGVAALLRYLELNSRRWLLVAGLCGGLSILAKITGFFYVAAVILFFIYREQFLARIQHRDPRDRGKFYRYTIGFGVVLLVCALTVLVHKIPRVSELFHLVLPTFALAVVVLRREFSGLSAPDGQRFATLYDMVLPFATGLAVPISVFLFPYYRSGALSALLTGLFVLPTHRFAYAMMPTPALVTMIPILCVVGTIVVASKVSPSGERFLAAILALGFLAILLVSRKSPLVCKIGWYSLACMIPVIIPAGAVLLGLSRFRERLSSLRQQQIMVLLSITALSNMVQFPFAANIYFCYVAPLALLTSAALIASIPTRSPCIVLGTWFFFYLFFALLILTPSFIYDMGRFYSPDSQTARLSLERAGGLRVDPSWARLYERLTPMIQEHAAGEFIYAAPDCPEIYFLSGLRNPTHTSFDFFDNPMGRKQRILDMIDQKHITVVAINKAPYFSRPLDPILKTALEDYFPHSVELEQFEVRWRE